MNLKPCKNFALRIEIIAKFLLLKSKAKFQAFNSKQLNNQSPYSLKAKNFLAVDFKALKNLNFQKPRNSTNKSNL